MIRRDRSPHPDTKVLALFACGDAGILDRCRTAVHVRSCAGCREEVEAFREARASLKRQCASLPPGVRWDRLAAEMTANIHLGVEAGECVAPFGARNAEPEFHRHMDWRGAAIMTAVGAVLVGAWFLNPPPGGMQHALRASPKVEIRTTSAGLELNENGHSLVLLRGNGVQAQRAVVVSSPGQLRERYVDADTGQITINHVYSE